LGAELYAAKLRAVSEVASAFAEIGRHVPLRTLAPLQRALWENAGFFPAEVRSEMLRIAARTTFASPDEVERVYNSLMDILRDDLGFSAIEHGVLRRVIDRAHTRRYPG
jgi:hypothetical protein